MMGTRLEDAMTLSLPIDADANELLSRSPLALLIAMLLDQQVPLEKAFGSPQVLVQRLGHEPTADELAGYDPEALAAVFGERPDGWREAAGRFGEQGSHYSVADIVDDVSLAEVRAVKKQLKAAAKAADGR